MLNQTNCPSGRATDQVFNLANIPEGCDVDFNGFLAIVVILGLVKVTVTIQHSLRWLQRERSIKAKQIISDRKRLPVVPLISWTSAVVYILFLVGTATDAFNVYNGWTAFLFGIGWLVYGLASVMFLMKFVSLGHRIALRSKSVAMRSMAEMEKLSKFDTAGKLSLWAGLAALLVQTILLCIVQMVPGMDREVIIRAAFGVQGYLVLQHTLSILHHVERVKQVIRTSRDVNKSASLSARKELGLVVRKLREQQFVLVLFSAMSVTYQFLVASGAFPLYWYTPVISMLIETCTFVLIALSDAKGSRKNTTKGATATVNDSRTGVVGNASVTVTDDPPRVQTVGHVLTGDQ